MNLLSLPPEQRRPLLYAALCVLVVLLAATYLNTGPRREFSRVLQSLIQAQQQLQNAQLLRLEQQTRLHEQEQLMRLLEKRPASFDLLEFLNQKLAERQLQSRAQLENYRPRNASPLLPMAQLQLSGVNLKELVEFLYAVYASQNLIAVYKVDKLGPAKDGKGLDCDMVLATIKPAT
jgi:hypothetical protein